jgi:hypothetical protein
VLTGGGGAPARRRKTPKSEDEKAEGALDFDVEEDEEEEEEDGGEDEKSTKFGGGDTKFIHPHDLCFIFFLHQVVQFSVLVVVVKQSKVQTSTDAWDAIDRFSPVTVLATTTLLKLGTVDGA